MVEKCSPHLRSKHVGHFAGQILTWEKVDKEYQHPGIKFIQNNILDTQNQNLGWSIDFQNA